MVRTTDLVVNKRNQITPGFYKDCELHYQLIKEVNATLDILMLFDVILDSVLVFLVVSIALYLVAVSVLYAAIPASLYLFYCSYSRIRKSKAKMIEEAHSELQDKLSAAFDNFYVENEMVNDLQEEVAKQMRKVELKSSFFSIKRTFYKSSAAVLLCFALMLLTVYGVQIDVPELVSRIPEVVHIEGPPGFGTELNGSLPSAGMAGGENIYGEKSIAVLGGEVMIFSLLKQKEEVEV